MKAFVKWDDTFLSSGKHFKKDAKAHAKALWQKHRRPVEIRDDHNRALVEVYTQGHLTYLHTQEGRCPI